MRKLLNKRLSNKKGFTLAELLIVVAIIAILVAIAIPAFSASLEKATLAKDAANVRSAYGEQVVKYLEMSAATRVAVADDVVVDAAKITDGTDVVFGPAANGKGEVSVTRGSLTAITFEYDSNVVTPSAP